MAVQELARFDYSKARVAASLRSAARLVAHRGGLLYGHESRVFPSYLYSLDQNMCKCLCGGQV